MFLRHSRRKGTKSPNRTDWKSADNAGSFVKALKQLVSVPAEEWSVNRTPWNRLVEAGRGIWGDRWVFNQIAAIAGGVRGDKAGSGQVDPGEEPIPLCDQAAKAGGQSGNANWWRGELESASSKERLLFVVLLLMAWASPKTLVKVGEQLDVAIESVDGLRWKQLSRGLKFVLSATNRTQSIKRYDKHLPALSKLSARLRTLLAERGDALVSRALFPDLVRTYKGVQEHGLRRAFVDAALNGVASGSEKWEDIFPLIEAAYKDGTVARPTELIGLQPLPVQLALKVRDAPGAYPLFLVGMADDTLTSAVKNDVKKVGDEAKIQGWF
jgi:hypothetical protein